MRVAVFSDVHANLPALETMLRVARPRVDGWVCLGDVVDFGPWNDECLRLVTELPGIVFIEGNHERLFLGTEPLAQEVHLVQAFTRASREHFRRVDLITGLRSGHQLGRFRCQHTLGGAACLRQPRDQAGRVFGRGRRNCHGARLSFPGRLVTAAKRFIARVFRLSESTPQSIRHRCCKLLAARCKG